MTLVARVKGNNPGLGKTFGWRRMEVSVVKRSKVQTVRLANCQTLRMLESHPVNLLDFQNVRLTYCKTVRMSYFQMKKLKYWQTFHPDSTVIGVGNVTITHQDYHTVTQTGKNYQTLKYGLDVRTLTVTNYHCIFLYPMAASC